MFSFTYARALERREKTKERDGEEAKERKMGNKRSLASHISGELIFILPSPKKVMYKNHFPQGPIVHPTQLAL